MSVSRAMSVIALCSVILLFPGWASAASSASTEPVKSTTRAAWASFVLGGMTVAPGTRADLSLPVPAGASDPATSLPLTVLRGSRPGPSLLVVAGVHGFEYVSILAAARLAQEIDPQALAGTLILARVAHLPAFEERTPYVNPYDRKNLNRSFPGKAGGSQTERIAHVLSTQLIPRADFVVDAHSGDGAEWLSPFVGVYNGPLATGYETALSFAEALGFPSVVSYRMATQEQVDRGRSLNRQAVAQGLPTVLIEIGENGQRRPEHVDRVVAGLQSAMATLEMLPPDRRTTTRPTGPRYFQGTESVPVAHSGIWYPVVSAGRDIAKGDFLGEVRDHTGKPVEQVRSPVSGFALYGLAGPPVRAGDSVMTIALPAPDGGQADLAAYPGYTGAYPGFSLILDERFDDLDESIWSIGDGAVGTEAMCRFQDAGVRVRDGALELIIDRGEVPAGWSEDHQKDKKAYHYFCGELRTRPERRMRYGRIEARMQAPKRSRASGYISSLFTYVHEAGDDRGRVWEEIDVELEGGRPDAFQANLIYGVDAESWLETRAWGAWEHKLSVGPVDRWRVFAIEWLPDRISWYVDGQLVKTLTATHIDCRPACIAPQAQATPIPGRPTDVIVNFWIPNDSIEDVFGGAKDDNRYPLRARYDWIRLYEYDREPLSGGAASD